MNTRHFSRWFVLVLAVVCLTVPFFANKTAANKAATQPQGGNPTANVKTAGGLTVVTFTADAGTIKVSLPDDIRAGDTISGTVIAEPKGENKEERAANGEKLKSQAVIIRDQRVPVTSVTSYLGFMITFPGMTASGAVITPDPKITVPTHPSGAVITPDPKITTPPGRTPSGAVITPDPKITPSPENLDPMGFRPSFFDVFIELDPSGAGRARIPVRPVQQPGMTPSGAVITPDPKITPTFNIPPLGQTGRPIVIPGPFDGDSSNTSVNWTLDVRHGEPTGVRTISTASFNKPELIAESPRKAVFDVPTNVTGPIDVTLKEGNVETKGTFRNLRIDLTAPKTSLLKGESTELHVEVNGLQGLKAPVPLTLEARGVITMVGGMYQPLMIQPSQVGADGRYTTTRGITGVQTGGWTATATVVTHKFDICLQDDTAPARRILWNTFNGDYIFTCPTCWPPKGTGGTTGESGGKTGGANTGGTAETGGTIPPADPNFPPTDPPTGLTGTGKMIMKGCIITLEHNAPDRRVFSKLDSCTTSGTSTIEDPKTKTKFTITDRNIADNTCQSQ